MQNNNSVESLPQLAKNWFDSGKSMDEIEVLIGQTNLTDEDKQLLLKEAKELRHKDHVHKGIILIAIGVGLCLMGCFITIFLSDTSSSAFHIALYGLTGSGAICITIGGMLCLGL